jgi:CubicO group peptidase (beta-lactamase class C family)
MMYASSFAPRLSNAAVRGGLALALTAASSPAQDTDSDGLPDAVDGCAEVAYAPGFEWTACDPMDLDPGNDASPECRARERVASILLTSGVYVGEIAFAVVVDGDVHFADAFRYLGAGTWGHDPDGVHRLYRVGSTSKAITATAAKVLDEEGVLSLTDAVDDEDGTEAVVDPQRSLRNLLSHDGAFSKDDGAIHLFCYPDNLTAFWAEPNDLVSPHYDSEMWGNLDGGYTYSAFNFALAGAYIAHRAGGSFESVIQSRLFDPMGMCTATVDEPRAAATVLATIGTSETSLMHVGPYINLVSPGDPLCVDNFYSSDDLYGDSYSWQAYRLDETSASTRDPAGGVIASVVDMAHFASDLLHSYHGTGGVLSPSGVRELWEAVIEIPGGSPYQSHYGLGFFTGADPGQPIYEVEHGGARAGYRSGFVIRPEANLAISILAAGGEASIVSGLGKTILDEFEALIAVGDETHPGAAPHFTRAEPNPARGRGHVQFAFVLPRASSATVDVFDVHGRQVGPRVSRRYGAGEHEVLWRTDGAAAGVYFVRLDTPSGSDTRRVVLVD